MALLHLLCILVPQIRYGKVILFSTYLLGHALSIKAREEEPLLQSI